MASFSGPTSKFRSLPVATVRLIVRLVFASGISAGCQRADGQSTQPEVLTEPLQADAIWRGWPANQDRRRLRGKDFYKQHIHIATITDSRMMREETRLRRGRSAGRKPTGSSNCLPGAIGTKTSMWTFKASLRPCRQPRMGPDSQLGQPRACAEAGRTDAINPQLTATTSERQFQERLGA